MRLRHSICIAFAWFATLVCAADFSGTWEYKIWDEVLNANLRTTIALVQKDEKVCGTWIEINYRNMELTANIIGVVKGDLLQLKTDGLRWGGDSPFEGDPRQEQFKLIRGLLFQLDRYSGQLPTKEHLASGILMKLSRSAENPRQIIGEESLAACLNGPAYQGWEPGQFVPPRARKALKPPQSSGQF